MNRDTIIPLLVLLLMTLSLATAFIASDIMIAKLLASVSVIAGALLSRQFSKSNKS